MFKTISAKKVKNYSSHYTVLLSFLQVARCEVDRVATMSSVKVAVRVRPFNSRHGPNSYKDTKP
jgi:hypothetical protein